MKYILICIIAFLSIISLITDVKRHEIDDWVSIVGSLIILLFIGLGYINRDILSYNLKPIELTLISSIVSGIITFVIFLLIPVGGGDMKYLAFISLYFGVWQTLFLFGFSCIIVGIYHFLTTKKYIRDNKEIFNKCKNRIERKKKLRKREVPLMIGLAPMTILFLILNII